MRLRKLRTLSIENLNEGPVGQAHELFEDRCEARDQARPSLEDLQGKAQAFFDDWDRFTARQLSCEPNDSRGLPALDILYCGQPRIRGSAKRDVIAFARGNRLNDDGMLRKTKCEPVSWWDLAWEGEEYSFQR